MGGIPVLRDEAADMTLPWPADMDELQPR